MSSAHLFRFYSRRSEYWISYTGDGICLLGHTEIGQYKIIYDNIGYMIIFDNI